jgi:hypothetical protein
MYQGGSLNEFDAFLSLADAAGRAPGQAHAIWIEEENASLAAWQLPSKRAPSD